MKRDYQSLLKDKKWIEFAEYLKEKENWKCEECQSIDKPLHAHHKQYVSGRKPWQYNPDLMQVLCKDCHEKKHIKKIEEKNRKIKSLDDELFPDEPCGPCLYCKEIGYYLTDLFENDNGGTHDFVCQCCYETVHVEMLKIQENLKFQIKQYK